MRLSDLFPDVEDGRIVGEADVQVHSLCYRSDQCVAGALFFCVPGFIRDGHEYAADAVARGAVALCVERILDLPVVQVQVSSVRRAMGPVSCRFFGDPSARLLTAGITGTNGKTTSAFVIAHLLDEAGLRSGLMGTVQRRIGGESLPAGRTTPEALEIQHDLARMLLAGDRAAVMEVSSHALDLGRVLGVSFRAVAFTNLTQDHLDYHGDLESYFAAKERLFVDGDYRRPGQRAVINIDDSFGRRLADQRPRDSLLTFSARECVEGSDAADLEWSDYRTGPFGTQGTLVLRGNALRVAHGALPEGASPRGFGAGASEVRREIKTRLVGAFNVSNVLTALGLGLALGLDLEGMLTAIKSFKGVPGRMETVDRGQSFAVLVDYAHTPDSVQNVLRTARSIAQGRLITVLGCGGDRDKGKRPLMGRAAEELSDLVIVTSDNPRTEGPEAIIGEILAGLQSSVDALVEVDRRLAIERAVREAGPGDVVMILGKGHEAGQEFAGVVLPFDDRQVAAEALDACAEPKP